MSKNSEYTSKTKEKKSQLTKSGVQNFFITHIKNPIENIIKKINSTLFQYKQSENYKSFTLIQLLELET